MSSSRWLVKYTFNPGVPYSCGASEYPEQTLKLNLDEQQLIGMEHTLELPLDASRDIALETSLAELECFLVSLRYLQLKPIQWWADASRIEPSESAIRLIARGTMVTMPLTVKIPPQGWQNPDPRLTAWLHFACEAHESQSPATAIRLYYLIIEDLAVSASPEGSAFQELKEALSAIRDFVSHKEITRPKTIERLKKYAHELKGQSGEFSYSPSSSAQSQCLNEWRNKARIHIDAEIRQRLGLAD